jgi:dienelactone hydrolase
VRTATVDLRPFFTDQPARLVDNIFRPAQYHDRISERYWGFSAAAVPMNGTVWYPDGQGPFPVVVAVHGNHDPLKDSEFGYDYLGQHLASHGMIFASIDQNFLNGITDGRENDARAALLLYHLHELVRQGRDSSTPLYGLVDNNRLAVMGHSRGGEAAVTSAIFNELGILPDNATVHFPPRIAIRSIIALAPIEGQYRPAQRSLMVERADFLYLHGSADGDVDVDFASRFLNRPGLSENNFRSGFWIYGANHAYFNSDWVNSTNEYPVPAKFRLTPEEQQRLCRTVVNAFLHVSFGIEPGYQAFLEDWRTGRHWLPTTVYATRFHAGSDAVLADFSEDADPRTATAPGWRISTRNFSLWREGKLPGIATGYFFSPEISDRDKHALHQDSHVVFLRGSDTHAAEYQLTGPAVQAAGIRFEIGAHPLATASPETSEELLEAEIVIEFENGRMQSYQLAELVSITPTPATFHLLRWSSRYYAPQTVQVAFQEPVMLAGFTFRFPARSDLEWHIGRIVAIQEGASR